MKRYEISEMQKGLKIKNGKIIGILDAGEYRTWNFFRRKTQIQVFNLIEPEFESIWTEAIIRNHKKIIDNYFTLAAPSDRQVAIVYRDNNFHRIIEPGKKMLFWNVLEEISVEYIDISEFNEIPDEKARTLIKRDPYSEQFLYKVIPENHIGILFVDGRLTKTITAGAYAYWQGRTSIEIAVLDLRMQNMEVGGQEILTKDKVSIRINFEAFYKILDAETVVSEARDLKDYLYKEFQFSLRKHLGSRTLDGILIEKESLSDEIQSSISEKARHVGVEVISTGIKDIILPGEMKEIMNQVVSAEKAAQANLVRRREEVAATRSLLNTAKMIESNPTLMRLKELEAIEKIADKVDSINVGGFGQLLNQLDQFKRKAE